MVLRLPNVPEFVNERVSGVAFADVHDLDGTPHSITGRHRKDKGTIVEPRLVREEYRRIIDAVAVDAVDDRFFRIGARVGMPGLKPGLTKEELRAEIRHERRIELAGEGLYYYDVRRWAIAQQVLNGDIYNEKGERIDTRRFNPARDNLWPIPAIAIQENTALEQNPGYRN